MGDVMTYLTMAMLIMRGVSMVESVFADVKGMGAVKKQTVTALAKGAVETLGIVSTGGQKETWENVAPAVDMLIETSVALINSGSKIFTGKPVIIEDGGEGTEKSAADTAALG